MGKKIVCKSSEKKKTNQKPNEYKRCGYYDHTGNLKCYVCYKTGKIINIIL